MDPTKLDKLKVVELRAELSARGLDVKGVKAVLVDRLKAALEDGIEPQAGLEPESEPSVPPPGTPTTGTPSRRARRTRSTTRSPSPAKKLESVLETLPEEDPLAIPTPTEPDKVQKSPQKRSPEKIPPIRISHARDEVPTIIKSHQVIEEEAEDEEESEQMEQDVASDGEDYRQSETVRIEEKEVNEDVQEDDEDESKSSEAAQEKMEVDKDAGEKKADKGQEGDESREAEKSPNRKLSTEDESRAPKSDERRKRKRSYSRSRSKSTSRSRSRSSSSPRRSRSRSPRRSQHKRSPAPNADDFTNEEDEPTIEDKQFGLSWFDSDLHIRIDPVSFTSAKPITEDALSLAWSGARSNFGVRSGKVVYEVRLSEDSQVVNAFRGEKHLQGLRCGFSTCNTGLMLGESEKSFAYCSSGKKALNSEFTEYGKACGLDDVIGCYLDLDSTPCSIKFTLNGEDLGDAFEFEKTILGEDEALFPHILTKGYEIQLNFADNENLLANLERPKREKKKKIDSPRRDSRSSYRRDSGVSDRRKSESKEKDRKENESNGEKMEAEDSEKQKKEEDDNCDAEASKEEKKDEESKESEDQPMEAEEAKDDEDSAEKEEITEKVEEAKAEEKEQTEEKPQQEAAPAETEVEEEVKPREPVDLLPDYQLIGLIPEEEFVPGPQRPDSRKECEVIMLVGLPGAGKTHWAKEHMKTNESKRYDVIGEDAIIDKMKIEGKPRASIHSGKWERVYDLTQNCLSTLEEIATKRRRNFILDQTNVLASCQRRKMKGFGDFKRIAVVCIPNEEELKRRNELKAQEAHGNNLINESSLNNMKALFTLPAVEFGWFDEILYSDLDGDEAKEEVKKYNEKGQKSMQSSKSNYKRQRRDNYRRDDRRRYDDRRRDDYRGGSRWGSHDRRGQNNRWGGGAQRGGHWRDDRGYGGGGYDRRDRSFGGGGGGGGNWIHNNRAPRYDDRYYRPQSSSGGGGGGGGRYDYSGGRDNRDRYDRDRNGRRDSRGGNQRDFRAGHRDNHRTEDSRGGYERSSSKYSSDDYEYASRSGNSNSKSTNNGSGSQSNWTNQHGNWATHGGQQQPQAQHQAQQQAYWGYDQMQQGYGAQQQHWQMNSADPRQQQQWMQWWQQQQGSNASMANNPQYWTQYAQQAYAQTPVDGADHHTEGSNGVAAAKSQGAGIMGSSRSDSKKS